MNRLFWITYILDSDISLRALEPYAQHEDDSDVEPPGFTARMIGRGSSELTMLTSITFIFALSLHIFRGLLIIQLFRSRAESYCRPKTDRRRAYPQPSALLAGFDPKQPSTRTDSVARIEPLDVVFTLSTLSHGILCPFHGQSDSCS